MLKIFDMRTTEGMAPRAPQAVVSPLMSLLLANACRAVCMGTQLPTAARTGRGLLVLNVVPCRGGWAAQSRSEEQSALGQSHTLPHRRSLVRRPVAISVERSPDPLILSVCC